MKLNTDNTYFNPVDIDIKTIYYITMICDDDIKKIFGVTLKELRTEKGLSQETLGEYIDLQPDSVSTIERGKSFISCEVLTKLCNFFQVSPAVFFTPKIRIKNENREICIKEIKNLLPVFDDKTLNNLKKILIVLNNS